MTAVAGDLAKTIGIEIVSRTVASTITVGDIVSFDATGNPELVTTTSIDHSIIEGFGVALETVTSGKARIAVGNTYVYAVATTGDTVPFQAIGPSTGGGWSGLVHTTNTATSVLAGLNVLVGRYMGHENEEDDPTAATTAEVGIVRLGL